MMKVKLFSLLAASVLMPVSLLAQPAPATVHGHVNNAAGIAITSGNVLLTTDKSAEAGKAKINNTFPIDASGDFKGTGVVPGDYLFMVKVGAATIDYQEVTIKAGEDKLVNFDMTRKEYLDKMSPEEKATLEEYKKNAGAAMSANKMIANLNGALKTVRDDLASANPNYDQDIATMTQATTQKPDEAVIWYNLGQVYVAKADSQVKLAKADHKPWQTDEGIMKLYNDGIGAYKKGIEANAVAKKPMMADAGIAWNSVGNAYAKMNKLPEATEAFDTAAKLAPASAGMVYGNAAAVLFNAGHGDEAAVSADKAIAADPNKPDPYYIKGQALIAKATVDKTGKIVAPPGCMEAYQKYLELAPEGSHAADAQAILQSMGQTVTTKYKAPGKK